MREERGIRSSVGAIWTFLDRADQTFKKKSVRASGRERPDARQEREAWFEGPFDLVPNKLVFVDETGLSRTWRRLTAGRRANIPMGHWKRTTFVAGLRLTEMTAPIVVDGSINGARFLDYVSRILAPTLTPGETVIIDNLSSHENDAVEAAGARVGVQPRYSPDFNPIENAFAKLKSMSRRRAARTIE